MPEYTIIDSGFQFAQVCQFSKGSNFSTIGINTPSREIQSSIKFANGNLNAFPATVRQYIEEKIKLCQPDFVHVCNGTEQEARYLTKLMEDQKVLIPLPKYKNCYLARTNPADVARVESKTYLISKTKAESVPSPKDGVIPQLGNWMSPEDMEKAVQERFPGCMKGRTMYVIPFSMGPINSPIAKFGVEMTDSPYVVLSMKTMTRMGDAVVQKMKGLEEKVVRALHSAGTPANGVQQVAHWPCDPERVVVFNKADTLEIISYGSNYGGNSLLGKKCMALRIGSHSAWKEGWLAEHMLILGITNPEGKKRYIAAAFPSACGKTNLAMMNPTLPGYKVTCVGDDIAWMKFNDKGELRAINPENGFFGVAPGTSNKTNPNAMKTIVSDTIFTNVAMTSDGGVYWEGLEKDIPQDLKITDWLGKEWPRGSTTPSSHPNSRFCTPCKNCPIMDPAWEDPEGVPIDAILFGGRRPEGIPLVYEALNWNHGVYMGASMRSEATAAAEHKGKVVMHDPFAMRPFFGYNFGYYLRHWLNIGKKSNAKHPKIYHVNWFKKDKEGNFLWPGYGENSRVLDWIFRRLEGEKSIDETTPIGIVPSQQALNLTGLAQNIDHKQLFDIDYDFWKKECADVLKYLEDQTQSDLPAEIIKEIEGIKARLEERKNKA